MNKAPNDDQKMNSRYHLPGNPYDTEEEPEEDPESYLEKEEEPEEEMELREHEQVEPMHEEELVTSPITLTY